MNLSTSLNSNQKVAFERHTHWDTVILKLCLVGLDLIKRKQKGYDLSVLLSG